MKVMRFLLLMAACCLFNSSTQAADITWASAITDPTGADAGFVDLLTAQGHNVTRYQVDGAPSADAVMSLNSSDLVIISRAVSSGNFNDGNGQVWNEQVTSPVIAMSGYISRNSRMGWMAGSGLEDSGATPLVASDPSHPIFAGISFAGDGVTMTNDYNVLIDRGVSTALDLPVAGGEVIATNPSVAGGNGVAIAAWPVGTVVTDDSVGDQVLAGHRYLFLGGSREPDGTGVDQAGVYDLTADGETLFLNTVNYALAVPEPSTWILCLTGFGILMFGRRQRS